MKKTYTKPLIEVEAYQLDTSIALNCGTTVSAGPEDFSGKICDEFKGFFGEDEFGTFSLNPTTSPFHDGVVGPACSCYYTSGNESYFTS